MRSQGRWEALTDLLRRVRGGRLVEGPQVVRLPNGNWRLYLDSYRDRRYFYSDSSDGLRTWTPLKELPGLSGSARHFGVIREPV